MKIKVSDYIADFLAGNGIKHIFTVTGGGAMHLNDSLGHHKDLHCLYNRHEQACAMAAESYARINNKIAAVCVTSGPGGTNTITGVLGGWLDSIPMLIISGQVKYETTARSTGLPLCALGDQEFDITRAVGCMTKFAQMVTDKNKIKFALQKALYLAKSGRPGPCWLDIPLDIQGALIDTDDLLEYDTGEYDEMLPSMVDDGDIHRIINKIKEAQRPVLYAGSGIRTSGGYDDFIKLYECLNIPVVTGWNSIDLVADDNPLYVGRGGIMGDRAGNFAVQNSDLVLSIGSRLSIRQVGYNYKTWAREAFTIVVDIDGEELKKPTVRIDMPIQADAKGFMAKLRAGIEGEELDTKAEWLKICQNWKQKYPVVGKRHYDDKNQTNVYAFVHGLSSRLMENQITVVGNGSACVVGSHGYVIKKGQRFLINSAVASMGYDLPAAIGACVGSGYQEIICLTGDGSIQMNLQELQTLVHGRLPIKIFLINNGGYHSIRQTQKNFFREPLVGVGCDSGDLSFPDFAKLSYAYGLDYYSCHSNDEIDDSVSKTLSASGPVICEVFVSHTQIFEPKSGTKQLADGCFFSAPLEDLAPFLPREEFLSNMMIQPVEEQP